jgi:hypothetical protein
MKQNEKSICYFYFGSPWEKNNLFFLWIFFCLKKNKFDEYYILKKNNGYCEWFAIIKYVKI